MYIKVLNAHPELHPYSECHKFLDLPLKVEALEVITLQAPYPTPSSFP